MTVTLEIVIAYRVIGTHIVLSAIICYSGEELACALNSFYAKHQKFIKFI